MGIRNDISEILNHPYRSLRFVPMIGDFVSKIENLTVNLFLDEKISYEQKIEMLKLANDVERFQNRVSEEKLISILKRLQEG